MVIDTASPLGSGSRCRSIMRSMALMMPSPNASWISPLVVLPSMFTRSPTRQISGSAGTLVGHEPL